MRIVSSLVLLCSVWASLSSCVTTPSMRIEENVSVFQSLPVAEQQLVREGRIAEGMSQQAVFLAWGYPNVAPVRGQKGGQDFERWVYVASVPSHTMTVWGAPMWGYPGYSVSAGPSTVVQYREEMQRSVSFVNGRVTEWLSR